MARKSRQPPSAAMLDQESLLERVLTLRPDATLEEVRPLAPPLREVAWGRRAGLGRGCRAARRGCDAEEETDLMTMRNHHGVFIECVQGDIAAQPDMEAVVNAANAELRIGGGVAGALHRAAGPGLEEECRPLAPIQPGQAVITGGHGLPNPYVIHCLGPVYGRDEPADALLAACYRNALHLVEQRRIRSVAFPAISTGAFGFPPEAAARIAVSTVLDELQHLTTARRVRFVLFGAADAELHGRILETLHDRM